MGNTSLVLKARKAAMYVRVSTEMQQYSTKNQADAIEQYAAKHNLTIVSRFEDNGQSGLHLANRKGLNGLLKEAQSGKAAFQDILVYDVSRWGRFQDVDESAFYEQLCKRSGVKVHYCEEQFQNDDSLTSAVLKAIKRSMAAEYSRELSVKVFAGQSRLVEMGFHQGGAPGYGLRRQLQDCNGNVRGLLATRQQKSIQSDRVVLVPGPKEECEVVRDIFRLFNTTRTTPTAIAEVLNGRGILNSGGKSWDRKSVRKVLTNEKYAGTNVYNRVSKKFKGQSKRNQPDTWIRCYGAFKAIIPFSELEEAKKRFQLNSCSIHIPTEEMLDDLRALLKRKGRLNKTIIGKDANSCCVFSYIRRFGSLYHAYNLIGYTGSRKQTYLDSHKLAKEVHRHICTEFTARCEALGSTVERRHNTSVFVVDHQISVQIAVTLCRPLRRRPCWRFCITQSADRPDITIVARLNQDNTGLMDYYVIPSFELPPRQVHLRPKSSIRYGAFEFKSLDFFINLACQGKSACPADLDGVTEASAYQKGIQGALIKRAPVIRRSLTLLSVTIRKVLSDRSFVTLLRAERLEKTVGKLAQLAKEPVFKVYGLDLLKLTVMCRSAKSILLNPASSRHLANRHPSELKKLKAVMVETTPAARLSP